MECRARAELSPRSDWQACAENGEIFLSNCSTWWDPIVQAFQVKSSWVTMPYWLPLRSPDKVADFEVAGVVLTGRSVYTTFKYRGVEQPGSSSGS